MSNHPNGHIKDIEREIDRDRAHFSETLSALESKFSPGQIVDQVLGYAKRNGGDFSDNLIKTIAHNPIPTILTGVGVAWMALSQNSRSSEYRDPASGNAFGASYDTGYPNGSFDDNRSTTASSAKDKLKGMGDSAHQVGDKARHAAEEMRLRGRQQWANSSRNAAHFFEENPLAVGAAAIAIGALIGAALPTTAREKQLLGSTGGKVVDKVKSMADDAGHTAKEASKAGVQAAKERVKDSSSAVAESH